MRSYCKIARYTGKLGQRIKSSFKIRLHSWRTINISLLSYIYPSKSDLVMYGNSLYHRDTKTCGKVEIEWETLAQVRDLTNVLRVKYLVLLNQSLGVLSRDSE